MYPRDERVLDAAIEVLATGGMRRLTHRAVDAAAALPMGSTSNRFRTRDALLVGVLRRILARETEMWTRFAADIGTPNIASFAAAIGGLLERLCADSRVLSQARRTIFVEAGTSPVLRDEIVDAQGQIISWMAPLLAELGSADPPTHVRHLLALMDGLIGSQLASPRPDFAPAAAVAALLDGLIRH